MCVCVRAHICELEKAERMMEKKDKAKRTNSVYRGKKTKVQTHTHKHTHTHTHTHKHTHTHTHTPFPLFLSFIRVTSTPADPRPTSRPHPLPRTLAATQTMSTFVSSVRHAMTLLAYIGASWPGEGGMHMEYDIHLK